MIRTRWLPGLATLREYQAEWLRHDIVAGVVLATMLVPVGIAYAVASGVPGICGLYATIVPLLAYALFGPSRILVLGPDSSLAAVILGVVFPLSGGDPVRAVALASMMAVVSGIVCILAGVARLGFVTELLIQTDPLWIHERNRADGADQPIAQAFRLLDRGRWPIARIVGDWQAGFGWKSKLGRICDRRRHIGGHFLLLKKNKRCTRHTCCRNWRDGNRWCIGPRLRVPTCRSWGRSPRVYPPSLSRGLPRRHRSGCDREASLSPCIVRRYERPFPCYAARLGTKVDPNQEMVGLGAANLAAGFFHGFPISSSSSRTPVAEAAGARTQLTGVVGALSRGPALIGGTESPADTCHLPHWPRS